MNAGTSSHTPSASHEAPFTSAAELAHDLYAHHGPFTSFYAPVQQGDSERETAVSSRFHRIRDEVERRGASDLALLAIDSRLALPVADDTGAVAVFASADGHSQRIEAHESPATDTVFVETLPYLAPVFEWEQWRVPHVAVSIHDDVIEEVLFVAGQAPSIRPIGTTPEDAAVELAATARSHQIELIALAGEPEESKKLSRALAGTVPATCEIHTVSPDSFSDEVVRLVADKVARTTVAALREFRFLDSHDSVAQGIDATVGTLQRGIGDLLLVHDDPDDDRTLWFGARGSNISVEQTDTCSLSGRLVDVLIRSAVLQDIKVRVVPSTADSGPDEDVGLLLRDPFATVPAS